MKHPGVAVIVAIVCVTNMPASAQTIAPMVIPAEKAAETDLEQQLRVIGGDPQSATDVAHRAVQSRGVASELRRTLDDAIAAFDALKPKPRRQP